MADKKISALTAASTPLAGTEVLPIVQSGSTVKVSVDNLTAGRDTNVKGLVTTNNVGVGTASPDIFQRGYSGRILGISSSATSAIELNSGTGNGAYFDMGVNGTRTLQMYSDVSGTSMFALGTASLQMATFGAAPLIFSTNNVAAFRVDTNQNIVIQTAGKGIDFSANTHAAGMTSELLNDYEEGTWTPTDASGAGLSLTVSSATYTKIGRQVTAQFDVTFPATADTATQLLGGLPFLPSGINFGGFVSYTTHGAALNLLVFASGGNGVVSFRQAAGGSNNNNAAYSGNVIRGVLVYFV